MSRTLNIATASYPLDFFDDVKSYQTKISDWVSEAADNGAQLLVFPEYAGMELATLSGAAIAADMNGSLKAASDKRELQSDLHMEMAATYNVFIIAGSLPCTHPSGGFTNMARIYSPSGKIGEYHKLMPTPCERSTLGLVAGDPHGLTVFDLGFVKLGLVICYDVEFPLISRALAEAGAEVIVAPSDTELEHGYWRVRTGCAARALENQVFTVQSPLVGAAEWSPVVDQNRGTAGVFAPPDHGFPANGVVALGQMDSPGWVYAELDLDLMAKLRESGGVQTFHHWDEQPGAATLPKAQIVSLI